MSRARILQLCERLELDAERDHDLGERLLAKACEELKASAKLRAVTSRLSDADCLEVTKDWKEEKAS